MATIPFKRVVYRALTAAIVLYAGCAFALPPEHEIRRLMLATEQAISTDSWGDASEYLGRLQQLDGERPVDFQFFRGRVMQQFDLLNEAHAAFEAYVTRAGKEGQYYQQALERITEVEKLRKDRALAAVASNGVASPAAKIATIEPAGLQSPADLKSLYLADTEEQALLAHLNSTLALAGWRENRTIVQLQRPADIRYQVENRENSLHIQEIKRERETLVRQSQQIDVYGVSPLIEWGCEPTLATCWVYDPRDGSRLFQLAFNKERVEDVARTLGRLIRNLQGSAPPPA